MKNIFFDIFGISKNVYRTQCDNSSNPNVNPYSGKRETKTPRY